MLVHGAISVGLGGVSGELPFGEQRRITWIGALSLPQAARGCFWTRNDLPPVSASKRPGRFTARRRSGAPTTEVLNEPHGAEDDGREKHGHNDGWYRRSLGHRESRHDHKK